MHAKRLKVEVLTQLLCLSKSNKVQIVKCKNEKYQSKKFPSEEFLCKAN